MTRWEYLSLGYWYEVSKGPNHTDQNPDWHYLKKLNVWRPGAKEPQEHLIWHSDEPDFPTTDYHALLQELGQEGWELVSESVRGNAVGAMYGWSNASWPIEVTSRFKRPLPEPAGPAVVDDAARAKRPMDVLSRLRQSME